jgi:hypothetical protein
VVQGEAGSGTTEAGNELRIFRASADFAEEPASSDQSPPKTFALTLRRLA